MSVSPSPEIRHKFYNNEHEHTITASSLIMYNNILFNMYIIKRSSGHVQEGHSSHFVCVCLLRL